MRPGNLSTRLNVTLGETILLGKIVREFGEWHGIPEDALFVVNLSLDELVTNIVTHSQKQPPPPKEIVLRLSTVKGEVRAEVEDDGCAFNPLNMPAPDVNAPLQERGPDLDGLRELPAHRRAQPPDDFKESRLNSPHLLPP
jgi:serine/threonine-protein kinase RsbW